MLKHKENMKKRNFLLLLVLFLALTNFVYALGPVFERHSGCNDPTLDKSGYSNCVEVVSCADPINPKLSNSTYGRLNQTNTYYLLMNDVSSNKSCIWYEADNSVFDLNNYTIYFGDVGVDGIPNHDFEIAGATEQDAENWDFSLAPHADRVRDNLFRISNDYLVRFTGVPESEPETIVSEWIWLNVTGRSYEGYTIFEECNQSRFLEVEREGEGIICKANISSSYSSSICFFNITSPDRYRLRIGLGAGDCRVDLADIRPRYDVGVLMPLHYPSTVRAPDYPLYVPHRPTNPFIKNGRIIEKGRGSSFGKGIYNLGGIGRVIIENVYTENHGYDSFNVNSYIENVTLRNSTIYNTNTFTRNRNQLYGPVGLGGRNNKVYNNIFSGGQGNLFFLGGSALYPEGNEAYNNLFFNNMTAVTNHYMVTAFANDGAKIYNNSFYGSCPAILLTHTKNSEVHDNFINLTAYPCNSEYPTGYSTSAVRVTDYCDKTGGENNRIYNNVFYGKAAFDSRYPSCKLSIRGFHISTGSLNNTYFNNYINVTAEDSSSSAYAVHHACANGTGGYFYNNILSSNQFIIWSANNYVTSSANIVFDSNKFIRNGNDPRFHTAAYGYCCEGDSWNNTFLNNSYFNGASIYDIYPNSNNHGTEMDYNVKWYLDIYASDGSQLIDGAIVTIFDRFGTPVHENELISGGRFFTNLTEYYAYTPDAWVVNPAPFVYTNYTPYNVTVTYFGQTQSKIVDLDHSQAITFYFGGKSPDVNGDGYVNIKDLALDVFWQGKNNITDADWDFFDYLDLNRDGKTDFDDVNFIINNL